VLDRKTKNFAHMAKEFRFIREKCNQNDTVRKQTPEMNMDLDLNPGDFQL